MSLKHKLNSLKTYLLKKCIHEAIPSLDVDGGIVRPDVIIVTLGLKLQTT